MGTVIQDEALSYFLYSGDSFFESGSIFLVLPVATTWKCKPSHVLPMSQSLAFTLDLGWLFEIVQLSLNSRRLASGRSWY